MSRSDDWSQLAGGWERGRAALWEPTRAISEWLVAQLDPKPGETVLELSAGTGDTGFIAAPLLGSTGRLISTDREPKMVEAAERAAARIGLTHVEFRVVDATAIPLGDDDVDGVISRFGYVLQGDPPPALREVRRVLRRTGRFAFAVWSTRERNAWMSVPADVMHERGHLPPPDRAAEELSERRNLPAIEELLGDAGFGVTASETIPVIYTFRDRDELWFFVSELRGQVSLTLASLPEAEREAVRSSIEERTRRSDGEGFELGGEALSILAA